MLVAQRSPDSHNAGTSSAITSVHSTPPVPLMQVPEEQDDGSADKAGASVVHYFL